MTTKTNLRFNAVASQQRMHFTRSLSGKYQRINGLGRLTGLLTD